MADDILQYELRDRVAVLRFDDGKANAVSPAALTALNQALDRAEKEAGAVALIGRAGRFSAGFDLSVMKEGPEAARDLVGGGAEFLIRIVESPLPIVAGATGHALAMGSLLLLAADTRIGTEGPFKIGLNEVAINMVLPQFAVELADERLSRRHLIRAVSFAEIYDPSGAVDAGYLDRIVEADALESAALEEAARLAELPGKAFAGTKKRLRRPTVDKMRAAVAHDIKTFSVG